MKLTGGQIIARALKDYGVSYVTGVPGHGIWSLLDTFVEKGSEIPVIPYTADIAGLARNFGVEAWKVEAWNVEAWNVEASDQLEPAPKAALECAGPALVEVTSSREAAGPFVADWWDLPSPAYYDKEQASYAERRALEQHM
jgi:thiamine pyrophosphate-dependent acetolactate synthase large subunit-like protein